MEAKQYVEKLNELAYNFRDDNDLCDTSCSECALKETVFVKNKCYITYCGILISILNACADEEQEEYDRM